MYLYYDEFLEECAARDLVPQTIATYRSNVGLFLLHLTQNGKDPLDIQMSDLRSFLVYLKNMDYTVGRQRRKGVAPATLKAYFTAISSFYDFLVWEKYIDSNPVPMFRKRYLKIKLQRGGENSRQVVSIPVMMELLERALLEKDIVAWAYMFFSAKTGMRKGELLAMNLADLDLEKMEFIVPGKAKRTNRRGFLDAETAYVLHQYLEWREPRARVDDALWISPEGFRMSRNGPYDLVTYYAQLIGIHNPDGPLIQKFTPHCFRHFFTTHLRRAGMSREFRMELRGDVTTKAMDDYDDIETEELRQAYLQYIPKLLRIDSKQSTLIPFAQEVSYVNPVGALGR
ncbi:integrase/recombinase XerD [Methanohalophilus levihalophilus]|uniref:tyrosine-type recombinase/integrase n=1 Tax=Methanohalophilus levihalophilus TaxID=1431282 RepID=UPI001AEB1608|nr:tyrosine-type recombinase/integrase [Methanohalophilus levihalophilus]MBP2029743.1 integrase/recombinase XerD [Methanohalophilus levihalophilus]